jgi:hypothetical protein
MKRKLAVHLTYSFTAVFLLASCAAPALKATKPIRSNIVFDANFDKTWSAVVESFAERNISVKQMEKASGYIEAEALAVPEAWADWGRLTTMSSRVMNPTARFNVFVKATGKKQTAFKLTCNFHATEDVRRSADEPETRPLTGVSTGIFEDMLYEAIASKLKP